MRHCCICRGVLTYVFAGLATLWCTESATRLLVKRSPALEENHYLVAYCCFVMYSAFALLAVY